MWAHCTFVTCPIYDLDCSTGLVILPGATTNLFILVIIQELLQLKLVFPGLLSQSDLYSLFSSTIPFGGRECKHNDLFINYSKLFSKFDLLTSGTVCPFLCFFCSATAQTLDCIMSSDPSAYYGYPQLIGVRSRRQEAAVDLISPYAWGAWHTC